MIKIQCGKVGHLVLAGNKRKPPLLTTARSSSIGVPGKKVANPPSGDGEMHLMIGHGTNKRVNQLGFAALYARMA